MKHLPDHGMEQPLDQALAAHWAMSDPPDDGAGFTDGVMARLGTAGASPVTVATPPVEPPAAVDAQRALDLLRGRQERQRGAGWAEQLGIAAGLAAALWLSGPSLTAVDPVQLGGGMAILSVVLALALLSAPRR